MKKHFVQSLGATQLRQIACICDALSEVELDDTIYGNCDEDATLINTDIVVTTRTGGRTLGKITNGPSGSYRFSQRICEKESIEKHPAGEEK